MRFFASAATESSSWFPASPSMASGSKASTSVDESDSDRTTTLHGNTAPMDGSTCIASCAREGRQAPRMILGSTSTSSLSFSVAATSISVRIPNPWSESASRVAATVASYGMFTVVLRVYVVTFSASFRLVAGGEGTRAYYLRGGFNFSYPAGLIQGTPNHEEGYW